MIAGSVTTACWAAAFTVGSVAIASTAACRFGIAVAFWIVSNTSWMASTLRVAVGLSGFAKSFATCGIIWAISGPKVEIRARSGSGRAVSLWRVLRSSIEAAG